MPEICRIGSVKIYMWIDDHGPPHAHVIDGRRKDKLFFELMLFEKGRLQARQQREVLEWARQHQPDLHRAWRQASAGQQPDPID